jgi:hypothetical protein
MKDPREQLRNFRTRFARRRRKGLMVTRDRDLYRADAPQDVTSPRAKGQRHRKVTAYRWNQ